MSLVFLVVALILSLTLHEFMHAWTSHYLGDTTAQRHGRLTLNPMAHIDPFMTLALPVVLILAHSPVVFGAAKPVPFNPWAVRFGKWGAAAVAAAGPLTNLGLAVFFSLWLRIFSPPVWSLELFKDLIIINIAFFVFNMIPFPPLDGSRVLYAAAPLGLREVMDKIERAGIWVFFVLLFVTFQFLAPLITVITGHIVQWLVPGLTSL